MRSVFGKVAVLALATVSASAVIVSCSSKDVTQTAGKSGEKEGTIGLNLQPVSGVMINEVSWTVTQGSPGPTVDSGILPVPGTGQDFSFGVPLPVGTGYFLSLTAVSTDGSITCSGSAGPFDVLANQSTDITPVLTCVNVATGQVIGLVDVVTDACPRLTVDFIVATPKSTTIGSAISVLSQATDADGNPITYAWSIANPAVGSFAVPTAQNTTFTCNSAGDGVVITVTANNGECDTTLDTKISCVNELCGNGTVDPGETCDFNDPTTPLCPTDCTQVCGDGIQEGSEACEPPNTAVCTATCQIRTANCGDTFVTPPETCEPPGTPTCSATCQSLTPQVCGNMTIESPELCDPVFTAPNCGSLHPNSVAGASLGCLAIESAACSSCVATAGLGGFDCLNEVGNAAGGPAAGVSRQLLCYQLLDCMYDTNCASADPVDCYCGTSGAACQTGGANGLCRTEIERSLESTAFGDIGARIGDPSFAGGVAVIRVDGSRSACGATCGTL
jgi:hypothetical protein